jgi:hypothetical protein
VGAAIALGATEIQAMNQFGAQLFGPVGEADKTAVPVVSMQQMTGSGAS